MTVIVYSTPRCPQCNATKRQLDRMGVPYRQIDVTVDTEASAMLRAAGYPAGTGRHGRRPRVDRIPAGPVAHPG